MYKEMAKIKKEDFDQKDRLFKKQLADAREQLQERGVVIDLDTMEIKFEPPRQKFSQIKLEKNAEDHPEVLAN